MPENAANLSKSYERNLTDRISVHSYSVTPIPLIQARCYAMNDGIPDGHDCEYDCFADKKWLS